MISLFEKYKSLDLDGSLICLAWQDKIEPYFCYPVGAQAIGFEGSIMYCFIPGYDEMVFAVNPEAVDSNVYPLAKDFHDFMRLILACGSANPVEQIIWMNQEQFAQHVQQEQAVQTKEQQTLLQTLRQELELSPMENPFEYVKDVQKDFDAGKIRYSNDYYDVLGLDRPDGTEPEPQLLCELTFTFSSCKEKE